MTKSIQLFPFTRTLFDSEAQAHKAAVVLKAILDAQSPRISAISRAMPGHPEANYKAVQRFLAASDPKGALLRLFQVAAPFVIGDPTEMPRPQAKKTAYVGTLKDGKTRGFWLLTLAPPYRGRALPFGFVCYSSSTIQHDLDSRNLYHFRAFAQVKALLGERPLVLDREFSYLELRRNLTEEGIPFVTRLNLGSHPPALYTDAGQRVELTLSPGRTVSYRQLLYQGQVWVNVIGDWKRGLNEPLGVMTDLEPERGLAIYLQRMKDGGEFPRPEELAAPAHAHEQAAGADGEGGGAGRGPRCARRARRGGSRSGTDCGPAAEEAGEEVAVVLGPVPFA